MGQGLSIAGVEHGPQMHGAALMVLAAIAVVGGLVYLAKRRLEKGRRRSDR